jgi:hypothetical protein
MMQFLKNAFDLRCFWSLEKRLKNNVKWVWR